MRAVLIVENEVNLLEGLSALIEWEKYGFTVVDKAVNGLRALEKMQSIKYDLILTDIRMPVMSGLQLLRGLRNCGNQVPVIMFSGYRDFEYAKTAIDFDAQGYLLKPIDRQELSDTIDSLIRKKLFDTDRVWKVPEFEIEQTADETEEAESQVRQVCQFVMEHYNEDIALSTLAKRFFINPAYLGQRFKKVMGVGFSDYLTNLRIQKAIGMMSNSDRKLIDISVDCGFNSMVHFDRCFSRIIGQLPSEYRKQLNGKTDS